MKLILTAFTLICSILVVGQTSNDHLNNGISKHQNQDYKGAIKDYDKAVKTDKSNKDAFFNRGSCKLALKDFKGAMTDFDKTIELDPTYARAYYSRATVYASLEKFKEALPDLDKTIELDPKTPNALTLRGQIRVQSRNEKGGCEDFYNAKANGVAEADQYIKQFCSDQNSIQESFVLEWPASENWKIGDRQENDKMVMIDYIPANETLDTWTEIGNVMTIKGVKNITMDEAMNMMLNQSKKNSPKAVLTFIEKDENAEYPWIIFKIESKNFKNDKNPESQLWHITQGKSSLYVNFRAVKEASISPELQQKWIAFFKTGKVVSK